VGQLESLKTVTVFSLLTDHIKDRIYKLSSLSVVTLGPVVTSSTLAKDKVVWTENPSIRSRTDRVHGSWLQIHQNCTGDILSTGSLVVVNVDAFQLEGAVANVFAFWVNAMFVGNDLPELGSDLVTTLASLKMDDFTHSEVELKKTNAVR
jgi:hypothetical protein